MTAFVAKRVVGAPAAVAALALHIACANFQTSRHGSTTTTATAPDAGALIMTICYANQDKVPVHYRQRCWSGNNTRPDSLGAGDRSFQRCYPEATGGTQEPACFFDPAVGNLMPGAWAITVSDGASSAQCSTEVTGGSITTVRADFPGSSCGTTWLGM